MSAQAWFNRIWYEGRAPWWLTPPALLYRGLVAARRALYRHGIRRTVRLARPVIIVGNLSVGGTGKTPLVLWLTAQLRLRGRSPGIVTRGFGGTARSAHLLDAAADADRAGDEPVLLARRSGVPVAIGRDRAAAARLLIDAGCDTIVSDDGLQHYALGRACEIAVVDAARRFGNGWGLPAGPLREPPSRLGATQAIVIQAEAATAVTGHEAVTAALAGFAGAPDEREARPLVVTMRLAPGEAVALLGERRQPLTAFAGTTVHAVAGIGNPQRFFRMLAAAGIGVMPHPLPDHARISAADIRFADGNSVLMTEKDAVKCTEVADARHWYVPVDAGFSACDAERLLDIVMHRIAEFERGAHEAPHG
jgi:tetraacyldisaccharide 4'-kinase